MLNTEASEKNYFPIREVARRTGVHSVTLRAWERRYDLLSPLRTDKGHRLYSEEEILRVERILQCLARGVSIGQVRDLLARENSKSRVSGDAGVGKSSWQAMLDETSSLIQNYAEPQLRRCLDHWFSSLPATLLLEHWLKPLHVRLERSRLLESQVAQLFFWPLLQDQLLLANGIARKNLYKDKSLSKPRVLLLEVTGQDQQAFMQMFIAVLLAARIEVITLAYPAGLSGLVNTVRNLDVQGVVCYSHKALPRNFLDYELPDSLQGMAAPLWLAGDFIEMQSLALAELNQRPLTRLLDGSAESAVTQLRESLRK
ncbi:MerR family transcriptional regulator [Microbulbifer sp. OS29]|uniref:MerR family transcriptional regulator n=1 Tax=Microbulbifer okhotskensis TaxID=2926617 RepID=A0A9X2ELE6_9GAMM|nr:MerR family transcriptional regulator [Microbulbifer okhotskensis]MCO1333185.1 MerR family transcriptional regulator [Microbulbifer okhotskensis]